MKHMQKCNSNAKRYFQVVLTPSEVNDGICQNFIHDTNNNYSNDEDNDIFHQDENNDDNDDNDDEDETKASLRKLFHL